MQVGSVNFSGLASGLDTKALIEAIINAERRPIDRLESRQYDLNQKKAALGEMRSKLSAFLSTMRDLTSSRTFLGRLATVSDETALAASASAGAETGLFSVDVLAVAAAHKVMSGGFSASDEGLVADGTITIQSGENEEINIEVGGSSGTNSLNAIRDQINSSDAGVHAAILFDGTDYRLIVRAEETGVDNALAITDSTDLGLDDPANLVTAAADASITIDGIAITSASNTISNAISGVTVDLMSVTAGSTVTLQVSDDIEGAAAAVQSLVDSYNEANSFFVSQFDIDNPGALATDSFARRLRTTLQSMVTGGLEGIPFGGIRSLSSIGVSFEGRSGEMSLDAGTLNDLLETRFDEIGDLFMSSGTAADPRIQFYSASSATTAGEYAVTVSQAAEQATLVGSDPIRDTGLRRDETLTIALGADETTVDIDEGMLIGEVVDAINAALDAAGLNAFATNDGGALRITTDAYGSEQELTVTSSRYQSNGRQTGFSETPTTDFGLDLAGTIGGVAATASGQLLTAAEGEDFAGLMVRVNVTADDIAATGGNFGTVSFSPGLMEHLTNELKEVTRIGDGRIETAQEIIETQLRNISDAIDRLEERLTGREARLIRMFTEAEKAIAMLQSQQGQLGAFM